MWKSFIQQILLFQRQMPQYKFKIQATYDKFVKVKTNKIKNSHFFKQIKQLQQQYQNVTFFDNYNRAVFANNSTQMATHKIDKCNGNQNINNYNIEWRKKYQVYQNEKTSNFDEKELDEAIKKHVEHNRNNDTIKDKHDFKFDELKSLIMNHIKEKEQRNKMREYKKRAEMNKNVIPGYSGDMAEAQKSAFSVVEGQVDPFQQAPLENDYNLNNDGKAQVEYHVEDMDETFPEFDNLTAEQKQKIFDSKDEIDDFLSGKKIPKFITNLSDPLLNYVRTEKEEQQASDIKSQVKSIYSNVEQMIRQKEVPSESQIKMEKKDKYGYRFIDGYIKEADLNLSCGIPTNHARILPGQTVVDLGCGTGVDSFIAREQVGSTGIVVGIDISKEMIEKANQILKQQTSFFNMVFKEADIEKLPVHEESVNHVISNCSIYMVPSKIKAYQEINRVLRPGGTLCISDIVTTAKLPEIFAQIPHYKLGFLSLALVEFDYMKIVFERGFSDVHLVEQKIIDVPKSIMLQLMSEEDYNKFVNSNIQFKGITICATKNFR